MSNNKQAGMPSSKDIEQMCILKSAWDERISSFTKSLPNELSKRSFHKLLLELYAEGIEDGVKKFCPPPKSEAEKEIDLIGAYDKAERFAKFLHDTYESVAKQKGWETQETCRVEFKDLPIKNKQTMIAVAGKILNSEELSRLLSAPSKSFPTEEEFKKWFGLMDVNKPKLPTEIYNYFKEFSAPSKGKYTEEALIEKLNEIKEFTEMDGEYHPTGNPNYMVLNICDELIEKLSSNPETKK